MTEHLAPHRPVDDGVPVPALARRRARLVWFLAVFAALCGIVSAALASNGQVTPIQGGATWVFALLLAAAAITHSGIARRWPAVGGLRTWTLVLTVLTVVLGVATLVGVFLFPKDPYTLAFSAVVTFAFAFVTFAAARSTRVLVASALAR